jgi:hypothetical protein
MEAITKNDLDASEMPASERVESFLECVETKRRRTVRLRIAALGVGAVVASVVFLTSIGLVPDGAKLAASTGALALGIFASDR